MDKQAKQKLLSYLWSAFQAAFLTLIKDVIVKKALRAFLGTATGAGFQAWLVKTLATEFYEEIAKPITKAVFVEAGYAYDKREGKIIVRKIDEAREGNDAEGYDSSVDDVMS